MEKSVSIMRPKYRDPAGVKQEETAHYSLYSAIVPLRAGTAAVRNSWVQEVEGERTFA